jgi:hypothetical protein
MGEATKRFKKNMWSSMTEQAEIVLKDMPSAAHGAQRQQFEQNMLVGEDQYMMDYHKDNLHAQDRKGAWKYRTFLPAAYRTAKSVAANCLEQGVPMREKNGDARGKTECERQYNSNKKLSSPESKTEYRDRAIKLIAQVGAMSDKITNRDDRAGVVASLIYITKKYESNVI